MPSASAVRDRVGDPPLVGAWGSPVHDGRLRQDPDRGWSWLGWFGGMITVVAIGDLLLAWYPMNLGVPEWEFGTIAASFAGLPLVTIGLASLFASVLARGSKWGIRIVAGLLLALAAWILAALAIFALDVPMALRVVSPEVAIGLKKAIAKTALLGIVFSAGYSIAAIAALRHAKRARSGESS